jgi:hypothetical protein
VWPTIFRFARDFELAVSRFELAALGQAFDHLKRATV